MAVTEIVGGGITEVNIMLVIGTVVVRYESKRGFLMNNIETVGVEAMVVTFTI